MADRFVPITVKLDSSQAIDDFNQFASNTAIAADQTAQAITRSYTQALNTISVANQTWFGQFQTIQQQMVQINQQTLAKIVDTFNDAGVQISSVIQSQIGSAFGPEIGEKVEPTISSILRLQESIEKLSQKIDESGEKSESFFSKYHEGVASAVYTFELIDIAIKKLGLEFEGESRAAKDASIATEGLGLAIGGALLILPALLIGINDYIEESQKATRISAEQTTKVIEQATALDDLRQYVSDVSTRQSESADKHEQLNTILNQLDPTTQNYVQTLLREKGAVDQLVPSIDNALTGSAERIELQIRKVSDALEQNNEALNEGSILLYSLTQKMQNAKEEAKYWQKALDDHSISASEADERIKHLTGVESELQVKIDAASNAIKDNGDQLFKLAQAHHWDEQALLDYEKSVGKTGKALDFIKTSYENAANAASNLPNALAPGTNALAAQEDQANRTKLAVDQVLHGPTIEAAKALANQGKPCECPTTPPTQPPKIHGYSAPRSHSQNALTSFNQLNENARLELANIDRKTGKARQKTELENATEDVIRAIHAAHPNLSAIDDLSVLMKKISAKEVESAQKYLNTKKSIYEIIKQAQQLRETSPPKIPDSLEHITNIDPQLQLYPNALKPVTPDLGPPPSLKLAQQTTTETEMQKYLKSQKTFTQSLDQLKLDLVKSPFSILDSQIDKVTKRLGPLKDVVGNFLKGLEHAALSSLISKLFGFNNQPAQTSTAGVVHPGSGPQQSGSAAQSVLSKGLSAANSPIAQNLFGRLGSFLGLGKKAASVPSGNGFILDPGLAGKGFENLGASTSSSAGGSILSSLGLGAMFSNPFTAAMAIGPIALPFVMSLFGGGIEKAIRDEVNRQYSVDIDKKSNGNQTIQQIKQIGEQTFGNQLKSHISQLVSMDQVRQLITAYATYADPNFVNTKLGQTAHLTDMSASANQFIRRAGGGPFPANQLMLVGEHGPEFVRFNGSGSVYSNGSTADITRGAVDRARANASASTEQQRDNAERARFDRLAETESRNRLAAVLERLTGVPAGHVLQQGIQQNFNALANGMIDVSKGSRKRDLMVNLGLT